MNIEAIREILPNFAKDTKLNLGIIMSEQGSPDLNIKQIYFEIMATL